MEAYKRFTGSALKIVAMVSMFIDHLGVAIVLWLIQNAYALPETLSQWVLQHINNLIDMYHILRYIGRLAFPIYCFLLVEGFTHTRSIPKYALRLGLFALLSEIPFDLALNFSPLEFSSNNVFFTLLLGLLCLWGIQILSQWRSAKTFVFIPCGVLIAAACILADSVFRCDYGAVGILAIVVIYLLRKHPVPAFLLAVLVLSMDNSTELYALIMVVPISLYNGQQGKAMKFGPYLFYPLHLLLFYGLRVLLLS